MAELIMQLGLGDKTPWEVVIRKQRRQRTLSQNGLYWKWMEIIGAEIGYEREEMHDVFREKFLTVKHENVFGVSRKILTSTSDPEFTTEMMAEYMDKIDRFAASELGIMLPHPDDEYRMQQANLSKR